MRQRPHARMTLVIEPLPSLGGVNMGLDGLDEESHRSSTEVIESIHACGQFTDREEGVPGPSLFQLHVLLVQLHGGREYGSRIANAMDGERREEEGEGDANGHDIRCNE